ncbi:30S ribosomal protein S6e [Candidatus Pacearchaeota archaeon]|nr:30S ribosomal protein S6e [Candidatus Pacearchaeota archaeon]
MPFKLNISEKGKAFKMETESEALLGKNVGDKVHGKDISHDLDGYELEITGGSDNAGFPLYVKAEGIGLKRVLLTKGWGMKDNTEGMRRRKTVRGKQIAGTTSQINMKVVKVGHKHLADIFKKEEPAPAAA